MTRLEHLDLQFRSPRSRPNLASRPLPLPTRFVLPALTQLEFKGVYWYLEDLLARIDAPLLHHIDTTFFMDLNFDLPQLHRIIRHGEKFRSFDRAKVSISSDSIQLLLSRKTPVLNHREMLGLRINCKVLEWQLLSLTQVCSLSFPLISTLEELEVKPDVHSLPHWRDDMENAQWLELLDPFSALKGLYLTDQITLHVCSALSELSVERITEVLPALQSLFMSPEYLLEGTRKAITIFVDARQRSGHPVSVHSGSQSGGWEDITKE